MARPSPMIFFTVVGVPSRPWTGACEAAIKKCSERASTIFLQSSCSPRVKFAPRNSG